MRHKLDQLLCVLLGIGTTTVSPRVDDIQEAGVSGHPELSLANDLAERTGDVCAVGHEREARVG